MLPVYFKWRKQSEFNNFSYVEETYQSCLCTTSAYIAHTWWWEQSDAWLRILMKYVHIENIRTQMMFKRICIGCWYANAIATYRYIQWCGCLRQCKIYCWKRSRQRKSREKNMEKSEPVQFKNENGRALGGFGAVVYLWFFFSLFVLCSCVERSHPYLVRSFVFNIIILNVCHETIRNIHKNLPYRKCRKNNKIPIPSLFIF